jgi:4-amino-4-deoxy-L-arabinose transferase-like glycosyltransferase
MIRARPALAVPAAVALVLYLSLALYQLDLPGLHYDEAREAGLPALQLLRGQPVEAHRDATVRVLGRDVPLMVQDYIGALQVVLAVPFLALFGPSAAALRLMPVALGALTIVLAGGLAQRLYGPGSAAVAMLLLAVQPSFVFWTRQGVFVTSVTALLGVALLLLLDHARTRPAALVGALFVAGLGLYAKLLFVWLIGAVAIVALAWLVAGQPWREGRTWRAVLQSVLRHAPLLALSVVAGLVALAPLLLFNAQTGGTFATLGGNLTHSYYGVNNLDFAENLSVRLGNLGFVLDGSHFWYLGGVFADPAAPWIYAAAVLALLATTAWNARPRLRAALLAPAALAPLAVGETLGPARPWLFVAAVVGVLAFLATERDGVLRLRVLPLALLGLIVVQSCFTVSDLFVTHDMLLTPLLPLLVAAAWSAFSPQRHGGTEIQLETRGDVKLTEPLTAGIDDDNRTSPQLPKKNSAPLRLRGVQWAAWLAIAALGAGDLWTDAQYHIALTRTGGLSTHSDAIYRLVDALRAPYGDVDTEPGPVVALDWGYAAQVQFLTGGAVAPVEVFGYTPDADPGFAERVAPWLAQPGVRYVFHSAQETVFDRRAAFETLAAPVGQLVPAGAIARRDGGPVFEIVVVQR